MALPTNIEAARGTAQTAAQTLGELTAGGYTIGDELKKKVQEAFDYNQDVIKPLDTATLSYVGSGSQALGKYADPTSPDYIPGGGTRQAAVSGYVQSKALPMLALGSILGQRFGRVEDFVGAGTNAYNAETARAQANYNIQRQLYQDLLGEYAATKPEYGQTTIEADGRKYLVAYDEQGNIINKTDIGAADTSGGGGGNDLLDLILGLNNEWVIDEGDNTETTSPESTNNTIDYSGLYSPLDNMSLNQPSAGITNTGSSGGYNIYSTLKTIGDILNLPSKVEETKSNIKGGVQNAKNIYSGVKGVLSLF